LNIRNILAIGLFAFLSSCATIPAETKAKSPQNCVGASWYALDGNRTANGEIFNRNKMTAAHKKYAFGTRLKVTNTRNGKSVVVRINDRGPFIRGRSIDLSKGAAKQIGMVGAGHAKVCYEVLK